MNVNYHNSQGSSETKKKKKVKGWALARTQL